MAQYLSEDLRIRVIRAVEGGMSRNAAARRFGVSIANAVRWMDAYPRGGRTAAKRRGGDRRSGRIEARADLLMGAIEAMPHITLAELRERLIAERGESFAISTIHDSYRRRGVTYKKRPRTPAGARGREGTPRGLVRSATRPRPGEAGISRRNRGDDQDGPPARARPAERERAGAKLLLLPPYSPDCNPIEQAIARIKALLRKAAARTVEALDATIAAALDAFTPDECANYFTNSAYEPDRSENALTNGNRVTISTL